MSRNLASGPVSQVQYGVSSRKGCQSIQKGSVAFRCVDKVAACDDIRLRMQLFD